MIELKSIDVLLSTITQTLKFFNERDERRLHRDIRKLQKAIREEMARPYLDVDHRYVDSLRLELKGILSDFSRSIKRSDSIPAPKRADIDLEQMFEDLDDGIKEKVQRIGNGETRPNEPSDKR